MYEKNNKVSLYSILKTFSAAMDLISKEVVGHHRQVAYIAYVIGKEMNLGDDQLRKLIISALIHDVGVFYLNETFEDLDFDSPNDFHAEVGYQLIRENFPIEGIPEIIRYHHHMWCDYKESKTQSEHIRLASILFLSDRIATLIDTRYILNKKNIIKGKIKKKSGIKFWPEAVQAFLNISDKEYFWLDTISNWQIERVLDKNSYIYDGILKMDDFLRFSEILSHIIDFRSSFTATHSNGVAVLAEKMGEFFCLDIEECKMLKIAGYLHDIGKLAVPLDILNKSGVLTNEEWNIMRTHSYYTYCVLDEASELNTIKEWAAYHHERLGGGGYPFHLKENELSLGSRIIAVVDVFTAITEDRPYRKGMGKDQVIVILNDMISNNVLDKKIVEVLQENYCGFDLLRIESQVESRKYYREFKCLIEKKKEMLVTNKKK